MSCTKTTQQRDGNGPQERGNNMHVMSVLLTRHSIEEIMVHVDPVIIDVCDFRRRVNFLFELKLPEGSLHCVKQTVSCLYDLRWKEMRRAWLFIRVSIVSMIPLCRTALRVTTFFINSHKVIYKLVPVLQFQPSILFVCSAASHEQIRNVSSILHLLQVHYGN